MASTPIEPRTLTQRERDVVANLLSAENAAAAHYRAQLPYVRVIATWGVGSPSVDLTVNSGADRATEGPADGIFANGAVVDQRGTPIGELILWVTDGRLSGIEYAWYTDERPRELPDPALITLL